MMILFGIGSILIYGIVLAGLSGLFCRPADKPRYMAVDPHNENTMRLPRLKRVYV